MFSIQKARPFVFTAVASSAMTLGAVFAYVAPASTVRPAPFEDRSGVASSSALIPWLENLSGDAIDAGGIERDLDGNAASLIASDQWCGRPACGEPGVP